MKPRSPEAAKLTLLASFLRAPGDPALDTLSRVCGSLAYARTALRWDAAGLPQLCTPELAGELPAAQNGRLVTVGKHRTTITSLATWTALDVTHIPDLRAAGTAFWNCCDDPCLADPEQAYQCCKKNNIDPLVVRSWRFDALL